MPFAWKLREISRKRNKPLATLIPNLLAKHKTAYAVAVKLKVQPNTVFNWLHNNGYRFDKPTKTWIKETPDTSSDSAA